jgi:hypothetical protein
MTDIFLALFKFEREITPASWLDLMIAAFTYRRQPGLSYTLLGAVCVLELLLIIDLFYVMGRVM